MEPNWRTLQAASKGANDGAVHDPRNVRWDFHGFARRYHSCRNRKWTDCCRRNVRFAQVAGHNRDISFHHNTHERDRVSFSHPRLHAGFRRWNLGLRDLRGRTVCLVQRAFSRRVALDLRDRRRCLALP